MLSAFTAGAQTTFQKAIGRGASDEAADLIQTADGSFVAAGLTHDPLSFDQNIFLVKLTTEGDTLWTRSIGANGVNEGAVSIRETTDGGFIICGTREIIAVDQGNMLLVKADDQGVVEWTRSFGGPNIETGKMAEQTNDGGFIALGRVDGGSTPSKMCLIKTDANGDTTWTRILGTSPSRYDFPESLAKAADGGFLIAGGGFESGMFQGMYLMRTDANGEIQWAKSAVGMTTSVHLSATSDGGAIVLGTNTGNIIDLHLIRFDAQGDTVWSRSYGGTAIEEAAKVIETNDHGFTIAGATRSFSAGLSDAYLVHVAANGSLVWSNSYGQSQHERTYAIRQVADGSYLTAGHTTSFGSGQTDLFVLRTDATGFSGCNEMIAATAVHTPLVVLGDVLFQSSAGIAVASPAMISSRGSVVSTECITTSTGEALDLSPVFLVGPSPATIGSPITINARCGHFDVLDATGRTLHKGSISGQTVFTPETASMLLVRYTACNGEVVTRRILVN